MQADLSWSAAPPPKQSTSGEKTIDEVYEQRTWLFILACNLALEVNCLKQQLEIRHGQSPSELKYRFGCRERTPDWTVAVLHLPGQAEIAIHARTSDLRQVSYPNLSDYPVAWDGSNDMINRIRRFTRMGPILE